MKLNPVGSQPQVVFSRAQYWGHLCLKSFSMIWMRGPSARSVSLQMTPSWVRVSISMILWFNPLQLLLVFYKKANILTSI